MMQSDKLFSKHETKTNVSLEVKNDPLKIVK